MIQKIYAKVKEHHEKIQVPQSDIQNKCELGVRRIRRKCSKIIRLWKRIKNKIQKNYLKTI